MKSTKLLYCAVTAFVGITLGWSSSDALADGTEDLGAPSIDIAAGTGIVVDGIGMVNQPENLPLSIPAGATVEQVLLYWEGSSFAGDPPGDSIIVNGNLVSGTFIGGPVTIFTTPNSNLTAYRADITDLGLVGPGLNNLTFSGMGYSRTNDGVGILVIIDDGSGASVIDIRDGLDFAFHAAPVPLDTTVPQTFTFAPASFDREAVLDSFIGSAATNRPYQIKITLGDGTVTVVEETGDLNGEQWSVPQFVIPIPAGETSATIQMISPTGRIPQGASLAWVMSGFSIEVPGEIGDTVFCDENRNGVQDGTEPGLPGVTVNLTCTTAEGILNDSQVTDANGNYLFTGLPPGDCTVTVDQNTAPPDCNVIIPNCPTSTDVALAPGQSYLDADFCFGRPPGNIGDTVFCDFNANGVQDGGEPGIPGVTVDLTCITAQGYVQRSQTTNANGNYLFTNIPPGDCTVAVDLSTLPPDCNVIVPNCPTSVDVNLAPGQSFLDADFCFSQPPGEIGDTVWCDYNRNGVQDGGEPGLPGVTINLTCLTAQGILQDSQVTNANGNYLFTNVPPGECTVSVDQSTLPPDCNVIVPNCPPTVDLTLDPGASFLDADFCFSQPLGEIGDTVFCDLDLDGVQDPTEPGLAGVTVDITCNTAQGVITDSQVTDTNGNYLFTDLPPGDCTVSVDESTLPPDCNIRVPNCPPSLDVNLAPGQSYLDADFCFSPPPVGRIGDTVFCDNNRNGIQDGGEAGIPGVTVSLTCVGPAGVVVRQQDTLANGTYLFVDLPASQCTVSIDPATAPPDCNIVIPECPTEVIVDLGQGETYLDADFCLAPPLVGSIGDTVFCDENRNGVQDGTEPGLPGVNVHLRCVTATGAVVEDWQTTDANGNYLFVDLLESKCNVFVDTSTAPPDCNIIIPECPTEYTVSLAAGENFLDADFCFAPPRPGEIGDTVFCDLNANGVQDQGDFGLPNVTVNLFCLTVLGPQAMTTMTDANGHYLFTGVLPGECTVMVDESTLPPDCRERVPNCPPEYLIFLGESQSFLDADFCYAPPCNIALEAFCSIPPPNAGYACDGGSKPQKITMLYTAEDCSFTDHQQDSGMVDCDSFGPLGNSVFVLATNKSKPNDRKARIYFAGTVSEGTTYVIDATMAGADDLRANTFVHIFDAPGGNRLQSVKFHTSCSQPIAVGNQFGANAITQIVFKDGRTVTMPDPVGQPDLQKDCTVSLQGGNICPNGDKVVSLDLLYMAEDCSATSHTQDSGKVNCETFGPLGDDVFIRVTEKENPDDTGGKIFFEGDVDIDTPFSATAANANADEFKGTTFVHVFASDGGALLQSIEFHTSCSQPLNTGDQFGSIVIFGATTEGSPVNLGAPVDFVYFVTNTAAPGGPAVTSIVVTDAFGEVPGSPIASIAAGDTVELTRSVTTTEDIVNQVLASAQPAPCLDDDTVTVTIVVPPDPPQGCDTKLAAIKLTYIGPDIPGSTTVVFDPNNGPNVTYNLPGGLFNGDTLSSVGQNGYSLDSLVAGERDMGSKIEIFINGQGEKIHTSCSVPIVEGQPAPLDNPKGDPSPNWLVEEFREKN